MIYLDYFATTPLHEEVKREIVESLELFGNPSSVHIFGKEAREKIEEAREKVALLIGAKPQEIYFTSGGTESDNLAIFGLAKAKGKGHIITSKIEHPAVLGACGYLEKEGFSITYIGVDRNGVIDLDELKRSIRDDTILISIMALNNEVGTLEPISEVGNIASERGIVFHTDAVQMIGKHRLDVHSVPVDMVSISSHKLYGPKGVGALYIRKGVEIVPQLIGGGQERGIRSGTENVLGILGFGRACELSNVLLKDRLSRANRLHTKLLKGLSKEGLDFFLNGGKNSSPFVASISFRGANGLHILKELQRKGFAVSLGAACHGEEAESHVLSAMGFSKDHITGTIRISFGDYTREQDIDDLICALREILSR